MMLARVAERRVDKCSEHCKQDIANMAWAFAKLGQADAQLFRALGRVAVQIAGTFNMQNLANIMWSFATVSQSDAQLLMTLAMVAEWRLACGVSDTTMQN